MSTVTTRKKTETTTSVARLYWDWLKVKSNRTTLIFVGVVLASVITFVFQTIGIPMSASISGVRGQDKVKDVKTPISETAVTNGSQKKTSQSDEGGSECSNTASAVTVVGGNIVADGQGAKVDITSKAIGSPCVLTTD